MQWGHTSVRFTGARHDIDTPTAVVVSVSCLHRLNATTGEYITHHQDPTLSAQGAPMGIAYLHGHLFVSTAVGDIHRFDALTGESYGPFAAAPNVMPRPNRMLWY